MNSTLGDEWVSKVSVFNDSVTVQEQAVSHSKITNANKPCHHF